MLISSENICRLILYSSCDKEVWFHSRLYIFYILNCSFVKLDENHNIHVAVSYKCIEEQLVYNVEGYISIIFFYELYPKFVYQIYENDFFSRNPNMSYLKFTWLKSISLFYTLFCFVRVPSLKNVKWSSEHFQENAKSCSNHKLWPIGIWMMCATR